MGKSLVVSAVIVLRCKVTTDRGEEQHCSGHDMYTVVQIGHKGIHIYQYMRRNSSHSSNHNRESNMSQAAVSL